MDGTSFRLGGDAQGDSITGFLNITGAVHDDRLEDTSKGLRALGQNDNLFTGGNGMDLLILGGDNDTGLGGNNDLLRGSRGQDTNTGGNGADRFLFTSRDDSTFDLAQRDTNTDFSRAEGDRTDLGQMDAQPVVAGNQTFALLGRFSGSCGQLRVKQEGADVLVLADLNGDRLADFAILVQGVTGLNGTDLVL